MSELTPERVVKYITPAAGHRSANSFVSCQTLRVMHEVKKRFMLAKWRGEAKCSQACFVMGEEYIVCQVTAKHSSARHEN